MKESFVVNVVKRELTRTNKYFVVYHGSNITKNGTPDILSHDSDNVLCGIECKRPGGSLSIVQWRTGLDMVKRGCRYIIACNDYDCLEMDAHQLPTIAIHDADEFDLCKTFMHINESCELVIAADEE